MLALKEGTGTDAMDSELLAKDSIARSQIKEQSHSDRYAVRISDSHDITWMLPRLVNTSGI